MQITTIGLDIAKNVFRFTALTRLRRSSSESNFALRAIPGIGVIGASTIAAVVPDPKVFRSGRDFAAWIGIVPRQDSTGGKHKLGPISKQGDRYLRRILVVGACAVLRHAPAAGEVSMADTT